MKARADICGIQRPHCRHGDGVWRNFPSPRPLTGRGQRPGPLARPRVRGGHLFESAPRVRIVGRNSPLAYCADASTEQAARCNTAEVAAYCTLRIRSKWPPPTYSVLARAMAIVPLMRRGKPDADEVIE